MNDIIRALRGRGVQRVFPARFLLPYLAHTGKTAPL